MQYRALGFIVWKGAKWFLRRKLGGAPMKVAAGGVVGLALGAGLLIFQRRNGPSS